MGRRLDADGRGAGDVAARLGSTGGPVVRDRAGHGQAPPAPARPGLRRRLRRAHPPVHAPGAEHQPHPALSRRHDPAVVVVERWPRRGQAAAPRRQRGEPHAHAVAGPHLLRVRPLARHEPVVGQERWQRCAPAHAARGLGCARRLALGRPHRVPVGRRSACLRHRQGGGSRPRRPPRIGPRPVTRALGHEPDRLGECRTPVAERRSRRAHGARPGVRRSRRGWPTGTGDARCEHAMAAGALPARRQDARGAVRCKR